jgi:hypothetical protein
MRHTTDFIRLAIAGTGLCLPLGSAALAQIEPEGFFPPSKPTSALTPPLPEPPQQRATWPPPDTKIPAKLVQAADWLFSIGLADPRGCEYREIEVLARDVWGQEEVVKTRGWVLPTQVRNARQFAVCWTGLVYPTMSVGAPGKLGGDMEAIIKFRQSHEVGETMLPMGSRSHRLHTGLEHAGESRLELPLLLRLGEADLAEAYWNTFDAKDSDRFLDWASVWAWYLYDRAITAHMLGDQGLALAMSRQLADARPRIEAAAAERGYTKRRSFEGVEQPYLYFLGDYQSPADPVLALLADSKRRIAAEKSPPLKEVLAITDQTKRIAALVRLLEEVDERQLSQPGGVALNLSRIVLAFEKEGEAAVEPLLVCFESDDRLTRSVEFSRDFGYDRHLIPVCQAAYAALVGVLHTDKFGPATTHGAGLGNRTAAAVEMRAFAKRAKGRTLAEQWYDTLADDNAHAWQWRDAALRIVQPTDRPIDGNHVELPIIPAGARPKLHGDELRTKNPPLSALLAKRIPQMTMTKELSSDTLFRAGDAAQMALALALWDPDAARPVLRQLIDRCHELLRIMPRGNSADVVSRSNSLLTSKLIELGEPASLREYAQWASRQRPNREIAESLFQPLWEHPDDPDAIAAVRQMFLAEDAPWRSLPRIGPGEYGIRLIDESVVASPLVGMSAFRENLLANLADKSRLGVLSVDDGLQNYEWDNRRGGGSSSISNQADPLVPPPGEERIIRVCDWYAAQLSTLRGAPKFEFYWPDDARDKAIEAMGNFLRERGDRLRRPAE